jgi:hypothetical protein
MDRWKRYGKVEATIVAGGGFFALKGVLQDANPRRMTVWQHEVTLVRRAIWCARSAHDVYVRADRHRESTARWCRALRAKSDVGFQ